MTTEPAQVRRRPAKEPAMPARWGRWCTRRRRVRTLRFREMGGALLLALTWRECQPNGMEPPGGGP